MKDKRRLISVIVLNEHGVLSRIVGLFSGRGYNIDSLTVAPVPNTEFSRVSIVTSGDGKAFEQIVKQLYKLIPIYKVIEEGEFVEKEMEKGKNGEIARAIYVYEDLLKYYTEENPDLLERKECERKLKELYKDY